MNLPKFVYEDVPLFLGLITDLFPGLDCPRVRYPNFNDAVEETLVKNNNVLLPQQVSFSVNYSILPFELAISDLGWYSHTFLSLKT